MARSRASEAFDSLWNGADAFLSKAEARLEVAHWLGRHPLHLDPDKEDEDAVLWAVEATRSYYAVHEALEPDEPFTVEPDLEEIKALLAPQKREQKKSKPKITPNRLWSKTSY